MDSVPLYAIADPHLGEDMSAHGWGEHQQALLTNWDRTVPDDAVVLLPGDISNADTLGQVGEHFGLLHDRPGRLKILSPGNHDSRAAWETQGAISGLCEPYPTLAALASGVRRFEVREGWPGMVLIGLTGSLTPGGANFNAGARRFFIKQSARLKVLLKEAALLRRAGDALILCIHYPPFDGCHRMSRYTNLIEGGGVELCVYGHVHVAGKHERMFQGQRAGAQYRLAAADYLSWTPRLLGEFTPAGLRIAEHEPFASGAVQLATPQPQPTHRSLAEVRFRGALTCAPLP